MVDVFDNYSIDEGVVNDISEMLEPTPAKLFRVLVDMLNGITPALNSIAAAGAANNHLKLEDCKNKIVDAVRDEVEQIVGRLCVDVNSLLEQIRVGDRAEMKKERARLELEMKKSIAQYASATVDALSTGIRESKETTHAIVCRQQAMAEVLSVLLTQLRGNAATAQDILMVQRAIAERISAVKTSVRSASDGVSAANAELRKIGDAVGAAGISVANASERVGLYVRQSREARTSVETAVETLRADVGSASERMGTVNERAENVANKIDGLHAAVDAMRAEIGRIDGGGANLEKMSEMMERISGTESPENRDAALRDAMREALEAGKKELRNMMNELAGIGAEVAETGIMGTETDIQDMSMVEKVNALESRVQQQSMAIETLKLDRERLKADVETLKIDKARAEERAAEIERKLKRATAERDEAMSGLRTAKEAMARWADKRDGGKK